jgi:hypothetical protein
MVDVLEDLERDFHDVMALYAIDMCNEDEAAGEVLVALGIQTVVLEMLDLGSRRHGGILKFFAGNARLRQGINPCNKFI